MSDAQVPPTPPSLPQQQESNDSSSSSNPAHRFLGLGGLWKAVANFGIAGTTTALLAYLVIWGVPSVQKGFHDELRLERDLYRQSLDGQWEHDTAENQKLADAVGRNQQAVMELQRVIAMLISLKTGAHLPDYYDPNFVGPPAPPQIEESLDP